MNDSLGVDIGGTKIQFCLVGPDLKARPLRSTPTALMRRGTTAFATDLAELIRAVRPPGIHRIGLSLNGCLNRGLVVYSSLMGGPVDFPLQTFLRDRLGCDVLVDDDIHSMTIAEAKLGAGRNVGAFAMLNIGTGIGVGCYTDRVLRGHFAAGLISEHRMYVDELGEHRSLDRTVCGRGMREIYHKLSGKDADAVTVFARTNDKDEAAQTTVAIFARYLGEALQLISRFYHPQRVIINGSIKRAAPHYIKRALEVYGEGLEPAYRAEISISELEHAAELGTLVGGERG